MDYLKPPGELLLLLLKLSVCVKMGPTEVSQGANCDGLRWRRDGQKPRCRRGDGGGVVRGGACVRACLFVRLSAARCRAGPDLISRINQQIRVEGWRPVGVCHRPSSVFGPVCFRDRKRLFVYTCLSPTPSTSFLPNCFVGPPVPDHCGCHPTPPQKSGIGLICRPLSQRVCVCVCVCWISGHHQKRSAQVC